MMAIWEDLNEEQEGAESQEEEEIVANLYFKADIVFDEETKVMPSELELSYDDLQKAYYEFLDDSQILSSHYASLKKNFQKLYLEFKNLELEKEKLRHRKDELLKGNNLLKKDINALKKVSESAQKTSSDFSKL